MIFDCNNFQFLLRPQNISVDRSAYLRRRVLDAYTISPASRYCKTPHLLYPPWHEYQCRACRRCFSLPEMGLRCEFRYTLVLHRGKACWDEVQIPLPEYESARSCCVYGQPRYDLHSKPVLCPGDRRMNFYPDFSDQVVR